MSEVEQTAESMNSELRTLFEADQAERQHHPSAGTPEYRELRERDAQRRQRVTELIAQGALNVAEDYYHAALIFQHGESVEDIWKAHTLASTSAQLGFGQGKWLAAAALDRWLMYQSKPQKYGTQFVPDGKRWRIWDVDPTTTDADRAEWDVPPLEEQLKRAEDMTRQDPQQPPMDDAPWWLKEALKRWAEDENAPA
ncbi:MAG TPA: DUF6624 domain-containing protein [Ktedonobacteraceae bacterium]|nr:DUF6624 domain-containing protein [Ktedonobacteraceae bacterium]